MWVERRAMDGKGASDVSLQPGVGSPLGRPVGAGIGFYPGGEGALELGELDNGAPYAALVTVPVSGVPIGVLVLGDTGERVLVNGFPPLPVCVLEDRDELSVGGAVLAFRTRCVTEITSFDGSVAETCPRCQRRLAAGDLARACGRCGAVLHEGERPDGRGPLLCFSYDPTCPRCGEPLVDDADDGEAKRG